MATDKKKQGGCKLCRKKEKKLGFIEDNLLKICLLIASTDLLHALFFVIQATISLVRESSFYSVLALLGTIFWVLCVILLIVGLWKRRPVFVKSWIIFSVSGFIADIGFIIWGLISSITVDWDRLNEFVIIFIGIFIESTNIYFVNRYYKIMDPSRVGTSHESGNRGSKKPHKKKKNAKEPDKKKQKKKSPTKKKSPKKK